MKSPNRIRTRHWAIVLVSLSFIFFFSNNAHTQSATPVSSCQTFTQPGTYSLTGSFTANQSPCFDFSVDNVTLNGNNHTVTFSAGGRLINIFKRHHITIQSINSNGGAQIYDDASDFFVLEDSNIGRVDIYYGDNARIENSQIAGLVLWGSTATIRGNTITSGGQHPVDVGGDGVGSNYSGCPKRGDHVFENNVITNTEVNITYNGTALYLRCSTHNTFRNNQFVGKFGNIAAFLRDAADHNLFEDNYFEGDSTGLAVIFYGDGGSAVPDPANNTFRRNIIRGLNSRALEERLSSGGNLYQNNVLWANDDTVAIVRVDTSAGGTTPDVFDHNTFYNSSSGGNGVTLGTASNPAWRGPTNFQFTNNIVSYQGTQAFAYDGPTDFGGFAGDHNLFHDRNGSVSFGIYQDENLVNHSLSSLAAWQAYTGEDANSLTGSPLFNGPGAGDFTLQGGSLAIGTGSDGSDIGAFGTGGPPPPPPPPPPCTENWQCSAWSACVSGQETRTCTDLNSCGTTNNKPAETRNCANDTTPPTVTIAAPPDGSTVGGQVQIGVTANDDTGVTNVSYLVDGVAIGSSSTTPFAISWDSDSVVAGNHSLSATASDAAGNQGSSQPISIITTGATPPPGGGGGGGDNNGGSSGGGGSGASGDGDASIIFKPEVPLPGFLGGPVTAETFAEYLRAIFVFFIWGVGVLAGVMIIFGGVKWVSAAGNPARINDARDVINNALIGLVIALTSVVLLNLISPRLTSFQGITLQTIKGNPLAFDRVVGVNGEGGVGKACTLKVGGACTLFNEKLAWPVGGVTDFRITSSIGKRVVAGAAGATTCHPGTDFSTERTVGKQVRATHSGKIEIGPSACNESTIKLHGDGFYTRYVHVANVTVTDGQRVQQNQVIGFSGGSPSVAGSCSSAPHLHVELYVFNKIQDIEPCLQ